MAAPVGPAIEPGQAKPLQYGICCAWGSTWSYNPYTSFFPGFASGFVYQKLAVQQPPSLTEFVPGLADKWTDEGNTVTVHIRDGQKWEDGTPVTTDDLTTTITLEGTRGTGLSTTSPMTATDKNTLSVAVRKGATAAKTLHDLLAITVYPRACTASSRRTAQQVSLLQRLRRRPGQGRQV